MPSPPSSPSLSDPTAVVGRRIGAFLIDGLIGVTLIFAFALATFTNTELGDSLTAELQCEVINEFSNDLCIQAGTTVYVGTENEAAIITLIWLAWVLISTMILPGITGWSPGKLLTGIRVVKADTFEKAGLGANIFAACSGSSMPSRILRRSSAAPCSQARTTAASVIGRRTRSWCEPTRWVGRRCRLRRPSLRLQQAP